MGTLNFNDVVQTMFYTNLLLGVLLMIVEWSAKDPALRNGFWRVSLQRQDGHEIVFNFEAKDSAGRKILYIINANERLLVDSVIITGDSVFIQMPFFESGFKAKLDTKGNLEGVWIMQLADKEQSMPFKAVYNRQQRFPSPKPPRYNISGRWAVTFTAQNNKILKAVGEFKQNGTHLSGTFLSASGDYRYLEGVVTGDSIQLSTFDGSHAYLFTAKIVNNNIISDGYFYSGPESTDSWIAKKDSAVNLHDGYGLTHMRTTESRLNFTFRSIDDKMVSLQDPRFNGKVVVVQILGSWCSNCMDETRFLSDYYNSNSSKGIEVIGLAYEMSTDFERSRKSLQSFRQRFSVRYPILITGVTVTDSLRTEKTLPQIERIKAFPTMILIDKKGEVRKIHTGFTGPGTGKHYELFRKEFDETINGLLKEK